MTNRFTRFEVFGDGRVVRTLGFASDAPKLVSETQIPREELTALITDLADSNALEREWALLPTVRAKRRLTSIGSTYLDVRLTRYRESIEKPNRSIHFRLGGYALSNAARDLPHVPDLAAIGRILSRLDELVEEHQRSRRHQKRFVEPARLLPGLNSLTTINLRIGWHLVSSSSGSTPFESPANPLESSLIPVRLDSDPRVPRVVVRRVLRLLEAQAGHAESARLPQNSPIRDSPFESDGSSV